MVESCVQVRLQYLYPDIERSFFRVRDFELSEDQICRTGLFGHAPDIAGVVLSADSMHIQFNERDTFSEARRNELRIRVRGPGEMTPPEIWIADHAGFDALSPTRSQNGQIQVALAGQTVRPEFFLRLEWTFDGALW